VKLNLQDSEPPEPEESLRIAAGVIQGLLITLVLHLLQVLPFSLIPLSGKAAALPGFFGFIQLAYMIPVIRYFQKQNDQGIVIGLIIGASLTFILGIPVAIFCASEF
jgi:Na+/proline symporter